MRVLLVHNYYRQPGGEDAVFAAEAALLRSHRQEVVEYTQDNRKIAAGPGLAVRTLWSAAAGRAIRRRLEESRPALAHFHNTFPLISPAGYYACRRAGVPVVQTLHNWRLLCPAATLFREGRVCEECLERRAPWPGVVHACYRGSRVQTAVVAGMLALHGGLRTWERQIDVYIAPSQFCRSKFAEGGWPAEKILVKPHFVHPDPGAREGPGEYALFAGRLADEKGVRPLLQAWQGLRGVPLVIAGDGPLRREVDSAAGRLGGIRALGWRGSAEVLRLMRGARFLVFPSIWTEPFGRVIIEAFACGLPVLADPRGAAGEIVADGDTGLHYTAGQSSDLAEKAAWLWAHPREAQVMGRRSRREFERRYAAEPNFLRLQEIYRVALAAGARREPV
jgi:glycosyltransferase involved in cell wall biosynthesis